MEYNLTPAGNAAIGAFLTAAAKLSPVAYRLQGYKYNFRSSIRRWIV